MCVHACDIIPVVETVVIFVRLVENYGCIRSKARQWRWWSYLSNLKVLSLFLLMYLERRKRVTNLKVICNNVKNEKISDCI
jgi:hypothetical protein